MIGVTFCTRREFFQTVGVRGKEIQRDIVFQAVSGKSGQPFVRTRD